jgi:hypothetical protein
MWTKNKVSLVLDYLSTMALTCTRELMCMFTFTLPVALAGQRSASSPGHSTPEDRAPDIHPIRSRVGPRDGMDDGENILDPNRPRTAIPRPSKPTASRYTDWATAAHPVVGLPLPISQQRNAWIRHDKLTQTQLTRRLQSFLFSHSISGGYERFYVLGHNDV